MLIITKTTEEETIIEKTTITPRRQTRIITEETIQIKGIIIPKTISLLTRRINRIKKITPQKAPVPSRIIILTRKTISIKEMVIEKTLGNKGKAT